jgi:hypothetical protein
MKSSQHKEILFYLCCLLVTQVENENAQVLWAVAAAIQITLALIFLLKGD